jgi:hypothetical protein
MAFRSCIKFGGRSTVADFPHYFEQRRKLAIQIKTRVGRVMAVEGQGWVSGAADKRLDRRGKAMNEAVSLQLMCQPRILA